MILTISISGHKVEYSEHSAKWFWTDEKGVEIFSDPQLGPVRAAIKKHEAKLVRQAKGKFVEWEAVCCDWNSLQRVTVISEDDRGRVWVRHLDKRRSIQKKTDLRRMDEPGVDILLADYWKAEDEEQKARQTKETIRKQLFPKP